MLFSIIIITLNEQENIESTIRSVRDSAKIANYTLPIEIIVSDGGSDDGTLAIAKKMADKVVHSKKGRYKQLNSGAKASNGEVLLFLHADTQLSKGLLVRLSVKMKDPRVVGGGFQKFWKWSKGVQLTSFMKFAFYIWENLGNLTVRLFKIFPGDNAIFVRRTIFERLGGFRPLWICEGFDLSLRLKRYCRKRRLKFIYMKPSIQTSNRRFEKYGFFNTLYKWFIIYFTWRLGMSSEKMKMRFSKYSNIPEKGEKKIMRF